MEGVNRVIACCEWSVRVQHLLKRDQRWGCERLDYIGDCRQGLREDRSLLPDVTDHGVRHASDREGCRGACPQVSSRIGHDGFSVIPGRRNSVDVTWLAELGPRGVASAG